MFKKIFGLFSAKKSVVTEVDPLELLSQNLEKAKAEDALIKEVERKEKEEELRMIERKVKLASIDRELEATYQSLTKGHQRVKKIRKRIEALREEERENIVASCERAAELRARFKASLYEEDDDENVEETPPVAPVAPVPPVAPAPVPPVAPAPVPPEEPEEPASRPKTPNYKLENRGPNTNVSPK